MRPCASVLCLGSAKLILHAQGVPTRLYISYCLHPSGSLGSQRFGSLQGHISKGVSEWDDILLSEVMPGLNTQTMAFVSSLETSRAASQSWISAGKWPASQGHICLTLQGHHCPRCSALQSLSCRSSYLSKVSGYSCYPKLLYM